MINKKMKPEVLAPAGDIERLYAAINFGADAVYLAGEEFGMRASATNFNNENLKLAVDYAHSKNVKVYVTCNTLPRNDELDRLPEFLKYTSSIGVDALIAADIGVFTLIRQIIPEMEVHISTQAGVVNYLTAKAFYDMGAKRVVLARELPLNEIKEIRENIPADMDIEVFVHGAMCMSFSGRCLLSNYLINRDANRGNCAQPCRWGYHLVEEKRPNEYYPVYEDEKGTYILNAKDLSMINHIKELYEAGITSFKIEGRAKSSYYVSVVTNAYRLAVDEYIQDPENYNLPEWIADEVLKVSHRQYSTGFYFDTPSQYYENSGYIRSFDVVAIVDEYNDGYLKITQKNKFFVGDTIEILEPSKKPIEITVTQIIDSSDIEVEAACHPLEKLKIPFTHSIMSGSIVRRQQN